MLMTFVILHLFQSINVQFYLLVDGEIDLHLLHDYYSIKILLKFNAVMHKSYKKVLVFYKFITHCIS